MAGLHAGHRTKGDDGTRWGVLALACLIMIGCYYSFDNPAALNESLLDHFSPQLSVSEFEFYFNLLYSVYALPNIFLPLLFGYFIDIMGVRAALVILNAFLVVGQAVVCLGCYVVNMPLMLTGRVCFGLGGESLNVAATVLLMQYFKEREMAMALGMNLCVARGGSVLNDLISPVIATRLGVTSALLFSEVLLILCMLGSVGLVIIDARVERDTDRHNAEIAASVSTHGATETTVASTTTTSSHSHRMSFMEAMRFGPVYWVASMVCLVLYCAILPFNNIASAFLVEEWYYDQPPAQAREHAGQVMSIIFAFSAVASPIFGIVSDKVGKRVGFCFWSSLLVGLAHYLLLHVTPEIPMILLGLGYTVFATVIWPCLGLAVDEHHAGTAYGFATALQNAGLFLVPLQVAYLRAKTGRYVVVEHMFIALSCLAAFFCVWLYYLDSKHGSVLESVEHVECEKEPIYREDLPHSDSTPTQDATPHAASTPGEGNGDDLKAKRTSIFGTQLNSLTRRNADGGTGGEDGVSCVTCHQTVKVQ
ncbi:unnamed protein product [Vitrella brassicaformis CCMP3155]|uniref:Lysosomal dipeptide transporter MFSD1 n=2 Tax=Vitrella brassicaformis TaxID=1169539 RepID=A0A0G4GEL1_VITBC|nr:unnamed protein product [Vitrella brassicaformis CCMP3155]|mmetsp:Transcript_30065/g.74670  ORF Transcript_30065/g.74670 Transcript_30065/m.74670 type:complete len:535 (+) Transcript_30065:51-1655(+)|eukprot:CEM27818.1 unnamed protein product [Vitrella brassicaformis CCMP3155]